MTVSIMQIEKPAKFITPPGSSFTLNLHYSFQDFGLLKRRITSNFHELISPVMEGTHEQV